MPGLKRYEEEIRGKNRKIGMILSERRGYESERPRVQKKNELGRSRFALTTDRYQCSNLKE